MPPALVTYPNVELIEAGEDWATSTGDFTWSVKDLQSAIASQSDPMIRTPVVKLGHVDPRFDGQPTVGRVENLRLTNNDQTLVGDLVGIPTWLAECMASAYPRRSVEGYFNYTSRSGNTWDFALTGVALLGTAYPAIESLEDVKALYGQDPPVLYPIDVAARGLVHDPTILVQSAAIGDADVPNDHQCANCDHLAALHNDTSSGANTGACTSPNCDCPAMDDGNYAAAAVPGSFVCDNCNHAASKHGFTADRGKNSGACTVTGCNCPLFDSGGNATSAAAGTGHMHAHSHGGDTHIHNHTHTTGYDHKGGDGHVHDHTHPQHKVDASISTDDVRNAFYAGPGAKPESYWWWIREVQLDPFNLIVDDDDGHLLKVPYVIDGESVSFSDPEPVLIEYIPATAASSVKYGNPVAAGRPRVRSTVEIRSSKLKEEGPDVKLSDAHLKALGLEADANEEQISAALDAHLAQASDPGTPSPQPAPPGPGSPPAPGTPPNPTPSTPPSPAVPTPTVAPEGQVLVDAAQWEEVKASAIAAGSFLKERNDREVDRLLVDAVKAGKFPPSRRDHYKALLAADPEGGKQLIDSLAEGLVPIQERGTQGGVIDPAISADPYPAAWKGTIKAAQRANGSKIRVAGD